MNCNRNNIIVVNIYGRNLLTYKSDSYLTTVLFYSAKLSLGRKCALCLCLCSGSDPRRDHYASPDSK